MATPWQQRAHWVRSASDPSDRSLNAQNVWAGLLLAPGASALDFQHDAGSRADLDGPPRNMSTRIVRYGSLFPNRAATIYRHRSPKSVFRGLKPGDRWCLCAPCWQKPLRRDKRRAWSCGPRMKGPWSIAPSPILNALRWTWPDARSLWTRPRTTRPRNPAPQRKI